MIKAVLFDMDGILFDTEIVMKEGWQKAARELNFTLTEEHLSQMRGSALPRSRKLFEEWFHGQVTYDEGRAIRTAYLNDIFDATVSRKSQGFMSFFPGSKSIRSKLPLLLLQRGALRKTIGNSLALTSISMLQSAGMR